MVAFRISVVLDGKGEYVEGKGSGKRGVLSVGRAEGSGPEEAGVGPWARAVAHPVRSRTASPM
jgi:hypothetical protein